MRQRLKSRWWTRAAVWVAVLTIFALKQTASVNAASSANRDDMDAAAIRVSVNQTDSSKDSFGIPLPIHEKESELTVPLSVNERPLARVGVELWLAGRQDLVLAVLLVPDRQWTRKQRYALKRFMLGLGDFPEELGAALLPMATTESRRVTSWRSKFWGTAHPRIALPAENALQCPNLTVFKPAWKAHFGIESESLDEPWSLSSWFWRKVARDTQRKSARAAPVQRTIRDRVDAPEASPLPEPVLFAGSDNLIWDAGTRYRATFLVRTPGRGDGFLWTHWATASTDYGWRSHLNYANFHFETHLERFPARYVARSGEPQESLDCDEFDYALCLGKHAAVNADLDGTPTRPIGDSDGLPNAHAIRSLFRYIFGV